MKLKYTFETVQLDDSIIAVPVGENSKEFSAAIKLNKTGAEIFELLNNDISEAEIISKLIERHDVALDECSAFVHEFIEGLNKESVLDLE